MTRMPIATCVHLARLSECILSFKHVYSNFIFVLESTILKIDLILFYCKYSNRKIDYIYRMQTMQI